MATYIIRRVLAIIPALLGISVITFLLMHATRGGPFDTEKANAAVREAQMRRYHLDEPVWPTFMGPEASTWQTLVLVLGLALFGVGLVLAWRKLAQRTILPPTLIVSGVVLLLWYLLMITQDPGTAVATGYVPGQFLRFITNLVHINLAPALTPAGPVFPTFLGPGSEIWRTVILVIGLAGLGGGLYLGTRTTGEGRGRAVFSTVVGALFTLWFMGMTLQNNGSAGPGFNGGQILSYLGNIVQLDLGTSFRPGQRPVTTIIGEAAGHSFLLGVSAFVLLVGLALPLGILAAVRQNTWVDYLASGISLIGYSIPNFVTGVVLILVTGLWLQILPIAEWQVFPRDLILPALVLAIRPLAVLTRLTRASMIEVLNQDYIRTAWAKGLGARMVLIRHALRNALLPVVTVMGDHLGDLVTGSIVVEALFSVPGIGKQFVNSVQARDYGVIMGTTLFYALLVLVINLVVDLLYGVIDPRIKLGAAARS